MPAGEIIALIGPSGAGKSTLIRCINRLVEPTSGSIKLGGRELTTLRGTALRHARRRIGMIFQEHALVDRLTVMENVLSGQLGYTGFWRSQLRRFPQPVVDRAFELLERVGIVDHVDKRADQLSGGQRQRIALGRALLSSPQLLLLDEPLSALDTAAKREILPYLERLARDFDVPVIYVSHAAREIERLANHVAFMQDGRVQSVVSLEQALSRPDSPLFADEGAVTVLRGELQPGNHPPTFRSGSLTLRLTEATGAASSSRLLIRARDVSLALDPPERMSILNRLPMSVRAIHPARNGHVIVEGQLTNGPILLAEISAWSCRELGLAAGTPVYALVKAVSLLD